MGMTKMFVRILVAAAMGAAIPVLAGQDNLLVTFSTKGEDRYADGSRVKDGENYALVWTRTGATFAGIAVDGKAVGDAADNRVLCVAPLAKDGHCPEVVVEIDKEEADRYVGTGAFSLHLLDTRTAAGEPSGVETGVNGFSSAQAVTLSAEEQFQTVAAPTAMYADNDTVLPESLASARITSIEVKDGIVRLTVAPTSKLLRYGVSSGNQLTTIARDTTIAPKDGNDEGDLVFETPVKGPTAFFTIGRAPLK